MGLTAGDSGRAAARGRRARTLEQGQEAGAAGSAWFLLVPVPEEVAVLGGHSVLSRKEEALTSISGPQ